MRLIKGNKFKIKGVDYVVTKVIFKDISKFERESYTFKTLDWDNPVIEYTISANDFESKVSFEQYVSNN